MEESEREGVIAGDGVVELIGELLEGESFRAAGLAFLREGEDPPGELELLVKGVPEEEEGERALRSVELSVAEVPVEVVTV